MTGYDEVTYNFTVDEFHTYYVTEYGVLVHNCGGNKVKWVPPPVKAFDNAGIKYTEHFATRVSGRGSRGITGQNSLEAYNNGRLYYNPATKNFLRHDPKTKVTVAVDKPTNGTAITVFEGNPSSTWNNVKWRPGSE